MCISTRPHVIYDNDKPWFTAKLLLQLVQTCTNTHWKRRSAWQRGIITKSYGFSSLLVTRLQCKKVWKTYPIARHIPSTVENRQLVDNLNEFYCRFVKTSFTLLQPRLPHTCKMMCVRSSEKNSKRWKALGPDSVTTACLKTCENPHLHTDLQQITAKSPHALNAPPSSPSQRNPKLLDLMTRDL